MALFGVGRLPLAQYWNESHNLKVAGSNPAPATKIDARRHAVFRRLSHPVLLWAERVSQGGGRKSNQIRVHFAKVRRILRHFLETSRRCT